MQRGRPQHAKGKRTRRNNRPPGACNRKRETWRWRNGPRSQQESPLQLASIQRSFEIVHRLGRLRLRDPPYPVSVESAATNSTERADLFYCCGALAGRRCVLTTWIGARLLSDPATAHQTWTGQYSGLACRHKTKRTTFCRRSDQRHWRRIETEPKRRAASAVHVRRNGISMSLTALAQCNESCLAKV